MLPITKALTKTTEAKKSGWTYTTKKFFRHYQIRSGATVKHCANAGPLTILIFKNKKTTDNEYDRTKCRHANAKERCRFHLSITKCQMSDSDKMTLSYTAINPYMCHITYRDTKITRYPIINKSY